MKKAWWGRKSDVSVGRGKAGVAGCRDMWASTVGEKGQRSPGARPCRAWEDVLRNLGFIIKAMGNHRQVWSRETQSFLVFLKDHASYKMEKAGGRYCWMTKLEGQQRRQEMGWVGPVWHHGHQWKWRKHMYSRENEIKKHLRWGRWKKQRRKLWMKSKFLVFNELGIQEKKNQVWVWGRCRCQVELGIV